MHHHHHHNANKTDISLSRLLIIILLNFSITAAETAGGLISGSLSLLSDALHNLSDGIAIIISYIALKLSKKPNTLRNTFGLKRAEIIAALFNTSFLVIIIFFLLKEAVIRLTDPSDIMTELMIAVASIGFTANLVSVLLLKRYSSDNINLKSAYLHLFADTLSSIAVIIGGVFIHFYHIYWLDPVITILICFYILKEGYYIIKKALGILMHTTPEGIDILRIEEMLLDIPDILNVHHIHIWQLNEDSIFFECHIDLEKDMKLSETATIRKRIAKILKERLNISHITIQAEFNSCKDKDLVNEGNCIN